ncbi:RodZ family helix-turn-helix domain-containing protein [Trichocoleus sp. FACHB-262]|uniref:helix-turn-helix domain-containing protein n=1 Tax=Trichocoleus sp. FACHB-262 TaxID=2692869 RepID=UPI0016878444|nr:helix-turn-helix domain-containing protein [Trichocoleus sp. FACHB-262]MBD2119845.1 helix-turn-helix domain-containing protein [Trichocoleus sp. FACHB-262]
MVLKPVYCSDATGNIAIEISQEELRTILGQIESELYHSEVYRRVLAGLQTMLGETAGGAQTLVKAVSREAIRLAFRQFFKQYRAISASLKQEASQDEAVEAAEELPAAVSSATLESPIETSTPTTSAFTDEDTTNENMVVVVEDAPLEATAVEGVKSTPVEEQPFLLGMMGKPTKKLTKAELAAQKFAQEREESLRQVGQDIRAARQARSLSLHQLHSLTLVPIHQLQALEAGRIEQLPEDVYVRGFIRRIGNALGLDGNNLVAGIPAPDPVKSVLPSWYHPEAESGGLCLRPVHLYVGYAALMAGAVGGLTWLSHQHAPEAATDTTQVFPEQASITPSSRQQTPKTTPGLKASKIGAVAGPDIAPPEAFSN